MKNLTVLFTLLFSLPTFAQDNESPLVSFDDYEKLMTQVKEHRRTRLVDLNQFNEMSAQQEVYILDTRSKEMYDRKHVKGAIHLNFSDFTQENLDALFPNRNVTILIYCNNNFMDDLDLTNIIDDQSFASKVSIPELDISQIELKEPVVTQTFQTANQTEIQNTTEFQEMERTIVVPETAITLALNIPTYINLFGYGYKNVYELSELVSVHDSRIEFEGTQVINVEN